MIVRRAALNCGRAGAILGASGRKTWMRTIDSGTAAASLASGENGLTAKQGRLAGRHILVTGGASGIGRAAVCLFASEGARVAALDIDRTGLADLASEAIATIVCDLSDGAAIAEAVDLAAAALGQLDGVVNCAGIAHMAPLPEITPESWRRIMAINLDAPYLVCRAAQRWLEAAGGGTIVTIASGQALLPNAPGGTAYAASKAGVMAFTKALAAELAPHIRCNVLCPGVVDTPMVTGLLVKDECEDVPFLRQYALGRAAAPEEMARVLLFLTSDESSYVTGVALAADGGRTFH